MKSVVLLIDLQNDFLKSTALEPAAGHVVERATRLLEGARASGIPVIHIWTTVHREREQRMPHWKSADRWICMEGTPGHETPAPLRPRKGESVVHKVYFSAFSTGELDRHLQSLKADTLIAAGVHLHGCIRSTILDAYQRGLTVWVAEDAVASDDPLHASISRRWLSVRAAKFASVESCLKAVASIQERDECPQKPLPSAGANQISEIAVAAREAGLKWRAGPAAVRSQLLLRLADLLATDTQALAQMLVGEIGKPITLAASEITRSIALLKAAASRAGEPLESKCTGNSLRRHCPIGVVAMITPWNNPIAIPLGKIAPALLYGNAVVWKPAPAGSSIALKLIELLQAAGCPPGLVNLVCGDSSTAAELMADARIDAVTITGSPAAGYAAQDICARRHIPLQAELGGNNAAIVWPDADLKRAAAEITEAAFAFAGQRCTANRRLIVHAKIYDEFEKLLPEAAARLSWGDPLDPKTRIGPVISEQKCRELGRLLERSKAAGLRIFNPHEAGSSGAFFPPTMVYCDDQAQEIFQEESFGPILVITKARDWDHAMQLCNGVRQGLVASLFSASQQLHGQFLDSAQAGILKINLATADADAEAPFGGWKASGVGPPEHGASNREFYTRTQSVYR